MSIIKKTVKKILLYNRHRMFKNIKLLNTDVSILSNCCIGGTMYNDLGLRFLSPTINLFFGHHGFIDFVNHIDEYKDAELINTGRFDIGENGIHGPICLLNKHGLPTIEIHFLHYASFEEARDKWIERYNRINKDKIFLVIEAKDEHEHGIIDEYVSLNYPKIIFTDLKSEPSKNIMHMKLYDRKNNEKSVTGFIDVFSHRGYDEFDFVNNIFNRDYNI